LRGKFHDLFLVDRSSRIKMYGSAWLVSTVFGMALVSSGTPITQSAIDSSVLIIIILVAWTFVYCFVPHAVRQPEPISLGRRVLFTCSAIVVSAALGLFSTNVEAAIVNRRLRKYTDGKPESDVKAVASTLDFARKNAIPVAPSTVAAVGSQLGRLLTNKEQPGLLNLAHRAAESAASLQSNLVTQPLNTRLRTVSNFPPHALFDRSYIHELKFELDTNAFLDSYIENCTVYYRGGPTVLNNTAFIRCDFQFSESPAARDLLLLFTQKNDPNFSYRADEVTPLAPEDRKRLGLRPQ